VSGPSSVCRFGAHLTCDTGPGMCPFSSRILQGDAGGLPEVRRAPHL
jgi:hypothetical protein